MSLATLAARLPIRPKHCTVCGTRRRLARWGWHGYLCPACVPAWKPLLPRPPGWRPEPVQ